MTVLEPVIDFLTTLNIGVKVSLVQVMDGADRPRRPVLRVMDRLTREGCLVEVEDNKVAPKYGEVGRYRRNPTWQLLAHPVYVNPKSPKRRTMRDRIWKAMRDKRRFTRTELIRVSGCSRGSVDDFVGLMARHAIIREIAGTLPKSYILAMKKPPKQRPIVEERVRKMRNDRAAEVNHAE